MRARDLVDPSAGVHDVVGDVEVEVTHVSALSKIGSGSLSFVKAASLGELDSELLGRGCAIICRRELAARAAQASPRDAFLISDHPRLSFMRLAGRHFPPPRPEPGIHSLAYVHASATIDPSTSVGAFCFVGPGCHIGPATILHPHVTLYEQVTIGAGVIVHAGTAIGADGFGYERSDDGTLDKFPHIGGVIIEDGVEIGSNTSIDRGSLENTILRRGCKVDNQVHVAHNVEIGPDAVVIAQSMIGGSVRIGARAWLAPAAVIMNQVKIGEDALVGLGAVVTKDVGDGEVVMGAPAMPQADFKAARAALKALARGR